MGTRATAVKTAYAKKYLKRVALDVQQYEYAIWKEHADSRKEPMNTFIKRAVRNQIEADRKEQEGQHYQDERNGE